MQLTAYVYIHNFFITACRAQDPSLTAVPAAVIKENLVLDMSSAAAAAGITFGMTKNQALRSCPDLRLLKFKPNEYAEQKTAAALRCYNLSPRVEPITENELFIDLSGSTPPTTRVFQELAKDLTTSCGTFLTVGLAANRLLAKAAGRPYSPAPPGLTVRRHGQLALAFVKTAETLNFASALPVEMMWPLDKVIIKRLKALGLVTFGDISGIPLTMLHSQFGTLAPVIAGYSQGIDKSRVPAFHPPNKIVYHAYCENTDRTQLGQIMKQAAGYISQTLREQGQSYREIELALFTEDGLTHTTKISSARGKYETSAIYLDCLNLLNKTVIDRPAAEIILTAANFTNNTYRQLAFFEDPQTLNSQAYDHQEKLSKVCESLAAKYSPGIITMGRNMSISRREQMLMFIDPFREGRMFTDG